MQALGARPGNDDLGRRLLALVQERMPSWQREFEREGIRLGPGRPLFERLLGEVSALGLAEVAAHLQFRDYRPARDAARPSTACPCSSPRCGPPQRSVG